VLTLTTFWFAWNFTVSKWSSPSIIC
jgi:hypothetical protein